MVPVGAGIWLFQKPYLKDPEALKEYREEYDKLTLVEGVKNHGWTIDYLQNCTCSRPHLSPIPHPLILM